jgi:hypothetical protein
MGAPDPVVIWKCAVTRKARAAIKKVVGMGNVGCD